MIVMPSANGDEEPRSEVLNGDQPPSVSPDEPQREQRVAVELARVAGSQRPVDTPRQPTTVGDPDEINQRPSGPQIESIPAEQDPSRPPAPDHDASSQSIAPQDRNDQGVMQNVDSPLPPASPPSPPPFIAHSDLEIAGNPSQVHVEPAIPEQTINTAGEDFRPQPATSHATSSQHVAPTTQDTPAYSFLDSKGETLHEAIISGDAENVRILLERDQSTIDVPNSQGDTPLHLAIHHKKYSIVTLLLQRDINLEIRNRDGKTALHQSVSHGDAELVRILFEKGANLEAVSASGGKPLWIAANERRESIARLLIQYGADLDSLNTANGTTALFEAVKNEDVALAKLLLSKGADVDALPNGPRQVARPGLPLPPPPPPPGQAGYMSAHHPGLRPSGGIMLGESKKKKKSSKKTKHSLGPFFLESASRNKARKSSYGFPAGRPGFEPPDPKPPVYVPPTLVPGGEGDTTKMAGENGGLDSVGAQGPTIAFKNALGIKFTFPIRIVMPWQAMKEMINKMFVADPVLSKVVQEGRYVLLGPEDATITPSDWDDRVKPGMRIRMQFTEPHVTIPVPPNPAVERYRTERLKGSRRDIQILKPKNSPLHQAILGGHPELVKLLLQYGADTNRPGLDGQTARQIAEHQSSEIADLLRATLLLEGPSMESSKEKSAEKRWARPHALPPPHDNPSKMKACQEFKATVIEFHLEEREQRFQKAVPMYELLYGKGPYGVFATERGVPRFVWYHLPANNMEWVEGLMTRVWAERTEDTEVLNENFKEKLGLLRSNKQNAHRSLQQTFIKPSSRIIQDETQTFTSSVAQSSTTATFLPYLHYETFAGHQQAREAASRLDRTFRPNDVVHPFHNLVRGYLQPSAPLESPALQLRRTLDQYFYSHVDRADERDRDQVIYRYTFERYPTNPKIFMVDQLWLWVLDDHTIITCSPLTWGSWSYETRPSPTYSLALEDPLNVQQKVLRYLRSTARPPVSSVHEMAKLIVDTCVTLFDQYNLELDLHFFDFFERKVASENDRATGLLGEFKRRLNRQHGTEAYFFDIQEEMARLIEVQDIYDELEILRMVLKDQDDTLEELSKNLPKDGTTSLAGSKVIAAHIFRIDRMQKIAKTTRKTLQNLLELKQNQANFRQSMNIAQQAASTLKQTRISTKHAKDTALQLKVMRQQADEAGKQSQTLMVFTIVTIVFLPSSFLAAVFAINLDSFPWDENDKLPSDYFAKYMGTISFAVSIPLLLIAFNLDRLANWWKQLKRKIVHLWQEEQSVLLLGVLMPCLMLVLTAVVLTVIWTVPVELTSGIKAAVTATMALAAFVTILIMLSFAVVRHARWRKWHGSDSGSSTYDDESSDSEFEEGWQNRPPQLRDWRARPPPPLYSMAGGLHGRPMPNVAPGPKPFHQPPPINMVVSESKDRRSSRRRKKYA